MNEAVPGGTSSGTEGGTKRYSVPQVARFLGISERAVRKRISAGTLHAERDGSRWWVIFAEPGPEPRGTAAEPEPAPGSTSSEPIEADFYPQLSRTDQHQLDLIRETLLAPLIEHNAALVEIVGTLEREAGRLTAERDQLRQRVRELEEATRAAAETPQDAQPVAEPPAAPGPTSSHWWQVWKR